MSYSKAQITKILSGYHMKFDRSAKSEDEAFTPVKCDRGWTLKNQHSGSIRSEWFADPAYVSGYLKANVKPCHCPSCMESDDWVHELPYLRENAEAIFRKLHIIVTDWIEYDHKVTGFFTSEIYGQDLPVVIRWYVSNITGGVMACISMSNYGREPSKQRFIPNPSTNSLYAALMGIRGDFHTPIAYRAEDMDDEGCEALGGECARLFARSYIYRDPASNNFHAMNRRDEERVRDNKVWWAPMYEPDDVMRFLKKEQARYISGVRKYSDLDGEV